MKRILFFLGLLGLTIFSACKKDKEVDPPADTPEGYLQQITDVFKAEGFANKIVPFSATPSNSVADLQALRPILANKQVVGLGEATHGTSEFQTIKHRMFQLLATDLGFKNLVIEDNFSAVVPVNEYIRTGNGDVTTLLNGVRSSMFKTVEFRNLVQWMRAYNEGKSESEKINLYGMDAQNPGPSAQAVQAAVQQYDNGYLATYNNLASSLLVDFSDFSSVEAFIAAVPDLRNRVAQIRSYVEANSNRYINGAGQGGYNLLLQHIRILEQVMAQNVAGIASESEGFAARDKNMADNVQWIEQYTGGGKSVVWVHNGHIALQQQTYLSRTPINVLGTNLKATYGDRFYSIGFIFNEGTFSAFDMKANPPQSRDFTVQPYENAILARALASQSVPVFFYDMRQGNQGRLVEVFTPKYETYFVGAVASDDVKEVTMAYSPIKEFDGFIFVRKTTALQQY
jgi:erythromycin esterase